jgi:hypothetical protein
VVLQGERAGGRFRIVGVPGDSLIMADTTEPTPPDQAPPESNPPGWLISPYRMAPAIEGEAVALAEVEAGQQDVPTLYAFDPTKPTIDQTRSAAITSIRDNFAALAPAATIDPTLYLPKTGGVALDLKIANPTSFTRLTLDSIAGQPTQIVWRQAGITRFNWEIAADGSMISLYTYDNLGALYSLPFQATRSTQQVLTGHNWVFGGTLAGRNALYPIDILKPYWAGILIQESTTNAARVAHFNNGEIYEDYYVATAAGDPNPASAGPKVHIRQQIFNGSVQERLIFDIYGGISTGYGVFASNYAWLGTVNGALDFRACATMGVAAGSVITAFTFAQVGQVARILVSGAGAITLPASGLSLPQGGAVWGGRMTLVGLINVDATITLLTFTPYDS